MLNRIDVVYAENKVEFPWLISPGMVYDENQIGQGRDRLYRCGMHQNWN